MRNRVVHDAAVRNKITTQDNLTNSSDSKTGIRQEMKHVHTLTKTLRFKQGKNKLG